MSVQTLISWFRSFWDAPPTPKIPTSTRVLVLDGTSVIPRKLILLIGADADRGEPVYWQSTARENFDSWSELLARLRWAGTEPRYIVCDGQRGLLKAIKEQYSSVLIQRCLIHVTRQARAWLTQNPKTRAGRELPAIVKELSSVQTRRQKRRWIRRFNRWCKRHERFLKERSYSPTGKRWWYTHRRLRGTRSLIKNAIPDLFRYVSDPTVPKTSNHVEGGINSRLKELFRCHRGLSPQRKLALAAWYLAIRQGQKPTRKFN